MQVCFGKLVMVLVLLRNNIHHCVLGGGGGGLVSSVTNHYESSCPATDFYCPAIEYCFPRTMRCTRDDHCVSLPNMNVCGAHRNGTFVILSRWESLPGLGGSSRRRRRRRRRILKLMHIMMRYKGFIYEYGASYIATELDPMDPKGKYSYVGGDVINYTVEGFSHCERYHVLHFNQWWNAYHNTYHVTANNCQDYYYTLLAFLLTNCTEKHNVQYMLDPYTYFDNIYLIARDKGPCSNADTMSWFECFVHVWNLWFG